MTRGDISAASLIGAGWESFWASIDTTKYLINAPQGRTPVVPVICKKKMDPQEPRTLMASGRIFEEHMPPDLESTPTYLR